MPCVTPLGHTSGSAFLRTLPHAAFPFADFALYLFTVINHSHEDGYMLTLVSPHSILLSGLEGPPNILHMGRAFLRSKLTQRKTEMQAGRFSGLKAFSGHPDL